MDTTKHEYIIRLLNVKIFIWILTSVQDSIQAQMYRSPWDARARALPSPGGSFNGEVLPGTPLTVNQQINYSRIVYAIFTESKNIRERTNGGHKETTPQQPARV